MRNIRLIIEYDGSAYYGWQCQKDGPSIQAAILKAIKELTHEEVRLRAAGRTDAGVHAYGQVANFFTASSIPGEKFALALNQRLPEDIAIRSSTEMPPSFDAKHDSKGKKYLYRIYNAAIPSPLERKRSYFIRGRELDVIAMQKAATYLIGEHNFESFRSVHCDAPHAFRNIFSIDITETPFLSPIKGKIVEIAVKGNAFCRHMVRIISGTLIEVGRHRYPPEQMAAILAAEKRSAAGITAEPQGLYLCEVYY